jgi:putative dimethyl sulfoxide reductase chaperone
MIHTDYFGLARLFVQELDAPAREALGRDVRFASCLPAVLQDARVEFARLFTMSVYPYESVFMEGGAELNGETTAEVDAFYRQVGFELPDDWMLGAADALGAELACLAWLTDRGNAEQAGDFLLGHIMRWAPLCCLAVERNARSQFYRMLGNVTRQNLMQDAEAFDRASLSESDSSAEQPEERDLQSVVNLIIAPSRSGIYMSKEDLHEIGQQVGIPVGLGDRGLMLANLLRGAGLHERVTETLEALDSIVREWQREYVLWMRDYPRIRITCELWHRRAEMTRVVLSQMRETALNWVP